jgi:hypothetical protein
MYCEKMITVTFYRVVPARHPAECVPMVYTGRRFGRCVAPKKTPAKKGAPKKHCILLKNK